MGVFCREERVALLIEQLDGGKNFHLIFQFSDGEEDVLLRDGEPYSEHGNEQSLFGIVSETCHFPGAGHFHTKARIGAFETTEAKLCRFDSDVIEINGLIPLIRWCFPKQSLCGECDEIHSCDFAREWEAAACPEIALNHFQAIVLCKEFDF